MYCILEVAGIGCATHHTRAFIPPFHVVSEPRYMSWRGCGGASLRGDGRGDNGDGVGAVWVVVHGRHYVGWQISLDVGDDAPKSKVGF
jgi:hypothetical protein